jgi:transposase InsO family protein
MDHRVTHIGEVWLYVSAVIDPFSRWVAGWSMCTGMAAQLIADALLMMVTWRRGRPDALMHTRPMESFRQSCSTSRVIRQSDCSAPLNFEHKVGDRVHQTGSS